MANDTPLSEQAFKQDAAQKESLKIQLFNILKKLDLDDAVRAVLNALKFAWADFISPFVVGGLCFFAYCVEGYEAATGAYEAYRAQRISQRKTRLITHSISTIASLVGVGLAVSYIVGGFGVTILGYEIMPFVLPAILTGICGLSLMRESYIFYKSKQEENLAIEALKKFDQCNTEEQTLRALLDKLSKQQTALQQKKIAVTGTITSEFADEALCAVNQEIKKTKNKIEFIESKRNNLNKTIEQFRIARLNSERELAFSSVELSASIVALVGTFFTVAALTSAIGLSAASFGIAPLVVLFVGVGIGMGSKIFEMIDDHHNHRYTDAIRAFGKSKAHLFENKINKIGASTLHFYHKKLFGSSEKTATKVQDVPKLNQNELDSKRLDADHPILNTSVHSALSKATNNDETMYLAKSKVERAQDYVEQAHRFR